MLYFFVDSGCGKDGSMMSKVIEVCDVLSYFFSSKIGEGWRDFTDRKDGTDTLPISSLFTAALIYCGYLAAISESLILFRVRELSGPTPFMLTFS